MMSRFIIIALGILLSFHASAQKRSQLKVMAGFDNILVKSDRILDGQYSDGTLDIDQLAYNKFYWGFGAERLIGNRIGVQLSYVKYLSAKVTDFYSQYSGGYVPYNTPSYMYQSNSYESSYSEKGYGISYESKFYFEDFDHDGVNSAYIGFSFMHARFSQHISRIEYRAQNANWNDPVLKTYPEDSRSYSINRYGVKFGYAGANALLSDFYLGVYLNSKGNLEEGAWLSPSKIPPVSFNIGWIFGVPFK